MQIKNLQLVQQSGKKYTFLGDFEQASASDIQYVDIELTPSQVYNIHTTPVHIIDAPWPNKMIVPAPGKLIYQTIDWWTTNFSPLNWSLAALFEWDWYNAQLCNSTNYSLLWNGWFYWYWTRLIVSPSSNIWSAFLLTYVYNAINKWVSLWNQINQSSSFVWISSGDRTIKIRFYYYIYEFDEAPILDSTTYPFTLKVRNTSVAFDWTETWWDVTTLYTGTSMDLLPNFTLNPVYEWAGVWNLWSWLVYAAADLNQQWFWAYTFNVTQGTAKTATTRWWFGSVSTPNIQFNVAFT